MASQSWVRYLAAMVSIAPNRLAERPGVDPDTFAREIAPSATPVVLRGQVAHWPAVAAGKAGPRAIAEYVARFSGGAPLDTMIARPEVGGRFFYDPDWNGFNFVRQQVPLPGLMAELLRLAESGETAPHAIYANAAAAPAHSPGWAEANRLDLPVDATARLWIGNAAAVATHYDASPNIACVVAGRRRFTLFPPDQLANLYIGPLDHTLAGPPVSMVDPEAPDLERYPRFAEAWRNAQTAELGPGDAIFMPALWWHHVKALDPINVLVNYWWGEDSAASPFLALVHAMMAVRDLPDAERAAWRGWFDHLVFDANAPQAGAHLPERVRTVLGAPSDERSARIRRFLIAALQRLG
ncbi:cupin-like domain-containing protein [Sphingomonas sp. AR_OL41]|uniref:cupin-like domain-containing protein n=1 Tax=Sphingomonas sp. AR_OL41 TaxID=3042729 RepID=UPI0024806C94|nr:cupin-like domain-containing protein [Sphingomonas sp. AR_OL41]MDH7970774.1 cupin-like domain-containing protein [Sphingomonas sp. AR_OL41]